MNKKEILAPVIVVLLAIAFIIVAAGVYFSRGKSKKWIAL